MLKNTLAILIITSMLLSNCSQKQNQENQTMDSTAVKAIEKAPFGKLPDGSIADVYTLANANGMEVKITNYGGTVLSLTAPDKNGTFANVTLACDSLSGYLKGVPYFGALIGRYGNRIAKGKFSLDGKTYTLPINNTPNSLHGGNKGFDKVLWTATPIDGAEPALKLSYTAADGEEGYPGKLDVTVVYTLLNDNSLKIDYQASTDKATVINLTNHTYFNLTGDVNNDILGHELSLAADRFLPVDATLIPTGELKPVKGTVFDFSTATKIGQRINDSTDIQIKYGLGYDHCWVLADSSKNLKTVATVHEPGSGRVMEVLSTEPAVQFYTGNFLDGTIVGNGGKIIKHRTGFCLETQHYPDSPNQASFPSTILRPGQSYQSTTIYKFSVK